VEYNSLFGPTLVTYSDGNTLSFAYDSVGNVVSRTKGNETTSFLYDDAYREVQIHYPDLSTVQFTYDENGNRLSMINDYSAVTYSYDNRGRMNSRTVLIDGNEYTFYCGYDVTGRMTSITYPDLTVIARAYDDLDRLTSIEGYAQFTYTVDSLLEAMTSDNGVVTTFSYDHRHRPLSITAEKGGINLLHLEYNYDPV
jgi:YD repeat-containing protein